LKTFKLAANNRGQVVVCEGLEGARVFEGLLKPWSGYIIAPNNGAGWLRCLNNGGHDEEVTLEVTVGYLERNGSWDGTRRVQKRDAGTATVRQEQETREAGMSVLR